MKTRPNNQRIERAFSLIEIMVAVTLLAVITVGLLAMFYHTQRAFRLGANQVDVLEGGRAAMQLISQEMQEMYPSHIPDTLNFSAAPRGSTQIEMPLAGGINRTNVLQEISFLTRRGDEWIGVTYRVHHDLDRGAGTLYRSVISTNPAIQNPPTVPRVPQWVVVSNLFQDITAAPTPNLANDTDFHRIIDGVVHLRVFAFDARGRLFREGRYNGPVLIFGIGKEYHFTDRVPAYLDLELGVLDPKALEQFRARGNNTLARTYLSNQGHRVQLFHQRIPIRGRHADFDLFAFQ